MPISFSPRLSRQYHSSRKGRASREDFGDTAPVQHEPAETQISARTKHQEGTPQACMLDAVTRGRSSPKGALAPCPAVQTSGCVLWPSFEDQRVLRTISGKHRAFPVVSAGHRMQETWDPGQTRERGGGGYLRNFAMRSSSWATRGCWISICGH